MASGQFFDPITALRVAPLISSTCSLLFAWDQRFFLSIFNQPEMRQDSKIILPSYFTKFFYRGTFLVITYLTATTSTAITNLYTQRPGLHAKQSFSWYVAGTVFAASHLLFVPAIAPSCVAIEKSKNSDDVNKSLDEWLSINTLRMLTVDLAAWISFAVAVTKTVRA